jgi:hypothetical protein
MSTGRRILVGVFCSPSVSRYSTCPFGNNQGFKESGKAGLALMD